METVVLVIHLLVCIALVGLVLLQKSEGGALGIGGPSGPFAGARRAADPLTRTTTILAIIFFGTSITLTVLGRSGDGSTGIIETPATGTPVPGAPATGESGGGGGILDDLGGLPPAPAAPSVPQSQ